MLGGSDVVIASRSRVRSLDGRDRLRRQLLAISDHTVTSAGTRAGTDSGARAAAGPGCSVRHDSSRRSVTGEQSLHTARTGRRRGYDSDVDEYRLCFPHDDIGCRRVELRNRRTRPTVLIRVSDRRNFSIPLRHSPGNDGKGCGSLTVGFDVSPSVACWMYSSERGRQIAIPCLARAMCRNLA